MDNTTHKNDDLLRRYVDNLYTKEDAKNLIEEISIQSPQNSIMDSLTDDVWNECSMDRITNCDKEKYKKEARILLKKVEHKKRTWLQRAFYTTISIAAMFLLTWGSVSYFKHNQQQTIKMLEASTTFGEHKLIRLPDGTELTLNSCSRVRFPSRFLGDERRVELTGEGYFNVTKNTDQPFIVDTRRIDIRVLGTRFNVKTYDDDELAMVNVESGKVQVDLPDAMIRLTANEQITLNTRSGEFSRQKGARKVATWTKGNLHFHRTPIRDVAHELERVYNCRISFAPNQEFSNFISGEHDNANLESVLKSIELTSGIHYIIKGQNVTLFRD